MSHLPTGFSRPTLSLALALVTMLPLAGCMQKTLPTVIISNMDVQYQNGLCYVVADVKNTSNITASSVTGLATLTAADKNYVVPYGKFDMNGQNDLPPGQTATYSGFVSVVNLTTVPVYINVQIYASGVNIGQASTIIPNTCHT